MPSCKGINTSKIAEEEINREYPEAADNERRAINGEGAKETPTQRTKTIIERIKGLKEHFVNGRFFQHYLGKDAAYYDAYRACYDSNKVKIRMIEMNRRLAKANSHLAGNPEAQNLAKGYKRIRIALAEARDIAERYPGEAMPEETKNLPEFIALNEDLVKKGKPALTLEQFIDVYSEMKNIRENAIASDDALSNYHAALNELANEKLEKIRKLDERVFNDLIGKYTNDLDAMDNIIIKLRGNKVANVGSFYKHIFGVDVQVDINSVAGFDMIAHHMIDSWIASMELTNLILHDQPTDELKTILEAERKNALGKSVPIDMKYVEGLEDGHPLKDTFKRLLRQATGDGSQEAKERLNKILEESQGEELFGNLEELARINMHEKLKAEFGIMNDPVLRNKVRNNRERYPELHKYVTNKFNYDVSKISQEINELMGTTKEGVAVNPTLMHEHVIIERTVKELKKQILMERNKNHEEVINAIKEKLGDYTFVTPTGTKIFNTSGRIEDMKDNKEVFGHIADLTDPGLLMKDVIVAKQIQDQGYSALVSKLIDGDVILVSRKQAETMAYIKNELTKKSNNHMLRKANKIFSMYTLFNPVMYPGYALTTQIFGNIGHTMMADPTAFRHWPTFLKELKKAWNGDYEAIQDPDVREIIKSLMTTENGSIHNMAAEDWTESGFENVLSQLERIQLEKMSDSEAINFVKKNWNKWMGNSIKAASIIEMISRGSMAYEILRKKRMGKQYLPPTANKHRVEHLWGLDDHLAAVRLANDTHIDYGSAHPLVRRLGPFAPFLSFKVGSSMNMARMFANTYRETAAALQGHGDWRVARSHMSRGAVGVVWRAGVAATIWNSIMVAVGAYGEEQRKRDNGYLNGNIFNELFGKVLPWDLDKGIYLPGTPFRAINKIFRIGKANQKWDVFQTAEGMIPGLDKQWRDAIKKSGAVEGIGKTMAAQYVSGLTPMIKSPLEYALGGGTLYESGYVARRPEISGTESLAIKAASFVGMGTLVREGIYWKEGVDSEYKDEAAYRIKDWKTAYDALDRTEIDNEKYSTAKMLSSSMAHMNTGMTLEYIAAYEHLIRKESEQRKKEGKSGYSDGMIHDKVRQAIARNTLAYKAKNHHDWTRKLTRTQLDQLRESIKREKLFLDTLGFGRW